MGGTPLSVHPEVPAYTHWTGKPITPTQHEILLVPQPITDGWAAFCSCGQWRSFGSFYDFKTKDEIIEHLAEEHATHQQNEKAPPAGADEA